MIALQVAFDALGAKHSAVERKILPGLETDHTVVFHLQLNATLLTTKAAVCFDNLVWLDTRLESHSGCVGWMWTKGLYQFQIAFVY